MLAVPHLLKWVLWPKYIHLKVSNLNLYLQISDARWLIICKVPLKFITNPATIASIIAEFLQY